MRVVSQYVSTSFNAGPKAKIDVEKVLKKNFNARIMTNHVNDRNNIMTKIKKALFYLTAMCTKDLVVIQFPFTDSQKVLDLAQNKVVLIHDIEGLRHLKQSKLAQEISMLDSFSGIIAHNSIMKKFLVEQGINANKIYVLELFDYLCEDNVKLRNQKFVPSSLNLIYTGNLDKAPFLRQLNENEIHFIINVYGILSTPLENKRIIYKGSFPPDELPLKLEGDLGLVWDGNLDSSDENAGYKNYTRYNNPHKLSCYIASNLPVIVWKQSAIADFVKKQNIGYVVDDLYQINDLDFSDNQEKKSNVVKLGEKVRNGFFTKKVFKDLLNENLGE